MKKALLIFLAILIIFVTYLKIPFYDSGIEDSYFDTKYSSKDISDPGNGITLLTKHAKELLDSSKFFQWLEKKYNCLLEVNFEWKNKKESDCKRYKAYIKKNKIVPWKEKHQREFMQDLLNKEIKVYSQIKEKDFIKYDKTLQSSLIGLVAFERAKIAYIHSISNEKISYISKLLVLHSLENNLALFTQSEGDIIFFMIYQNRVAIDLEYINFLLQKDFFSKKERISLLKILKKYPLDLNLYSQYLKSDFWGRIQHFDTDFEKSLVKNYPNVLQKISLFFLLNKTETREEYKSLYKNIIEGTHTKLSHPNLIMDMKNYFWKSFITWEQGSYKERKKTYLKVIEKIKIITNKL